MTGYLTLKLDAIEIDPLLVRRVSLGLASYYLALPLAVEGDAVSVAMAHPENETAIAVLRDLLDSTIVPVRASAGAIRAQLQRLAEIEEPAMPTARLLAWSDDQERVEAVQDVAQVFAELLEAPLTVLDPVQFDMDTVLTVAHKGAYSLALIAAPLPASIAVLLECSATPIILVQEGYHSLQRVLLIMRGYSSDEYTLNCLAPLLQNRAAHVTLMPLLEPLNGFGEKPLTLERQAKSHIIRCLRSALMRGVRLDLKLREGNAVEQVANELANEPYDLVVISAEGHGNFVGPVVATILGQQGGRARSLLIIKPPALLQAGNHRENAT